MLLYLFNLSLFFSTEMGVICCTQTPVQSSPRPKEYTSTEQSSSTSKHAHRTMTLTGIKKYVFSSCLPFLWGKDLCFLSRLPFLTRSLSTHINIGSKRDKMVLYNGSLETHSIGPYSSHYCLVPSSFS